MGTQCSCSGTKQSINQNEINHNPQQSIQPTLPSPQKNQSSKQNQGSKNSSEKTFNQQEATQQDTKLLGSFDGKSIKIQRKNQKRVHLIVPQQSMEENFDNIMSIQKQLDKEQQQLIVKTLNKHFILSQLSVSELSFVLNKLKFCRCQKDNYVFKQGDPSFSYYIIIEGKCKVLIDNQVKRVIQKGASFGDLGIIYNAPRSASIFAETQCIFAQLNSKAFKKIIIDLNSIYQKQNRTVLQKLQFYKNLSEAQKNTLASNAITEIYQMGQVIFNKGDAANAFYIVQQGIVTVFQKGIDLRAGQNVGVNAIISNQNAVRSNSLIAKTNCKLLSLTKEVISQNLGQSVNNAIRKNLILKIIKQSQIWEMYLEQQWIQSLNQLSLSIIKKGMIAFSEKTSIEPYTLCLILKADARSKKNPKSIFYMANSIIQQNRVFKRQLIQFEDDFQVNNQAQIVKLALPKITEKKALNKQYNCNLKPNLKGYNKKRASGKSSLDITQQLNLDDFSVIRKLRSGNFGKVYACYNKKNKNKYAIKVMNKTNLITSNILSYALRQSQLLQSIKQHPFLVKFYKMFDEKNLILLIMELLQGEDLFDAINMRLPLNIKDYRFLICQLIIIIDHIHNSKIIYRDLKPENVMLLQDGYVKLVDFGTAKQLVIQNRFKTTTIVGTPHYMAPQIILGKGYSFSVDWWSLGVIMYEMASGKLPFGEHLEDPFAVYEEVIKSAPKYEIQINDQTRQILDTLLTKNGTKRVKNGSSQLKQMQFFKTINWQLILKKQYQSNLFPSKSSVITFDEINRVLSKRKLKAMQVFLKDKSNAQ